MKLAEALGLNGTPSYVIGNDVVIGAVGLDALEPGRSQAARRLNKPDGQERSTSSTART